MSLPPEYQNITFFISKMEGKPVDQRPKKALFCLICDLSFSEKEEYQLHLEPNNAAKPFFVLNVTNGMHVKVL